MDEPMQKLKEEIIKTLEAMDTAKLESLLDTIAHLEREKEGEK